MSIGAIVLIIVISFICNFSAILIDAWDYSVKDDKDDKHDKNA